MAGKCGRTTEVYSRVTGYHRPVRNWNRGKQEEFKDRLPYHVGRAMADAKFQDQEAEKVAV